MVHKVQYFQRNVKHNLYFEKRWETEYINEKYDKCSCHSEEIELAMSVARKMDKICTGFGTQKNVKSVNENQ